MSLSLRLRNDWGVFQNHFHGIRSTETCVQTSISNMHDLLVHASRQLLNFNGYMGPCSPPWVFGSYHEELKDFRELKELLASFLQVHLFRSRVNRSALLRLQVANAHMHDCYSIAYPSNWARCTIATDHRSISSNYCDGEILHQSLGRHN